MLSQKLLRSTGTLLLMAGCALFMPACAVVEAPFTVLDTALDAPFKIAQTAIDAPFKPITGPMKDAQRRKANSIYAEKRNRQMDEARQKLIAEGKIPAPEIGPDGRPIYTVDNYLVPVSTIDSGRASQSTLGYKATAKRTTDRTPVDRPLPPSMGMAVPVPRNKAEQKAWKRKGSPSIVQTPAAVHPTMINIRDSNAAPTNAGSPGSGTVTYQPVISAPTRKNVYNGNGQEPRTDRGAIR